MTAYQVENALLENALGGDTTAQIFWLKNRRPDVWRDKRDVGVDGSVSVGNPFAGLTTEELRRLAGQEDINRGPRESPAAAGLVGRGAAAE